MCLVIWPAHWSCYAILQLQPNKDDMEDSLIHSRSAQPWSKYICEQKHVENNEHKNRNEIPGVNT